EVTYAQIPVRATILQQMVDNFQNRVRDRNTGTLIASPCRQTSEAGSQIGVLGVACRLRGQHQGAPQPTVTFRDPTAPSLTRALIVARADSCPGTQMPVAGKHLHVHSHLGYDRLRPRPVDTRNLIQLLDLLVVGLAQLRDPLVQALNQLFQSLEVVQLQTECKAWCSLRWPRSARRSWGILRRNLPRARSASFSVSCSPAISRSRMSRPETPRISVATDPSLILASSSTLWIRLATRVCSSANCVRSRVRSRRSRCQRAG